LAEKAGVTPNVQNISRLELAERMLDESLLFRKIIRGVAFVE
jgi:hypothetical protein